MANKAAALVALAAMLLSGPAAAAEGGNWGQISRPSAGPVRVLGGSGLGCIAGAVALPSEGPGWQVVRLSRNRYWGHPALVEAVKGLAGRARRAGLPDVWIGDLSQPRGGPMSWGHASHQNGLDVDIWFDLTPKPARPAAAREHIDVPSLVLADGSGVDPRRFTERHALLIRLAAETPGVDRVLVNHTIKRALCERHPGAAWLRYVRPWRGHDEHLHLRMRCPVGQAECKDLPPPPPGDGCDASLAWWSSPEAQRPPASRPGPPSPPPALPAACRALLAAP